MLTPEFSRVVPLARVSTKAQRFEISAEPDERAALARRFGILEVSNLTASVVLMQERQDGLVRLDAEMAAEIVQSCVVSLDPVRESIRETFRITYQPTSAATAASTQFDDPGGDLIEPLDDDILDIGEAVAQQLSLAMNPYPHAPLTGGNTPSEEASPE